MSKRAIIEKWRSVSDWKQLRQLSVAERIALHAATFAEWDAEHDGPAPIWFPTDQAIAASNLTDFLIQTNHSDFQSLKTWWQNSPSEFWKAAIETLNVAFREPPVSILEFDDPRDPTWLPKARLNIVESCFQADDSATALRFGGADGQIESMTYGELYAQVQLVAAHLRDAGFEPGDRLAIVMPMDSTSVVTYLAILYAGCAAVSIADSFAPSEIAKRIRISQAKGVFYCESYQRAGKTIALGENVTAAKQICESEGQLVRLFSDRYPWPDVAPLESPHIGAPDDVINVLFSSGTTGDPKAIPWDQTTPIKCAADGRFHQDIRTGDVVVWPTNLGWMMGPWLIFATLINGATIGLFEDAPTGEAFGKFVQDAKTTMLGVVPALVRHWKNTKCMEAFDWSAIRCFSSTGEASNAVDMTYLSALAGFKPIIEYCGGTEIGGGYISSTVIQPNVPGTFSTVAVGNRFVLLDEEGQPTKEGELFLVPPSIGLSRKLLNRDHFETYYAGVPDHELPLRRHGDRLQQLPGGYFRACGRTDDTMNPGGIKVGSAEIESIINGVSGIQESAVIAVSDQGTGPDQLVAFLVGDSSLESESKLKEINLAIRQNLNPLIRIARVRVLDKLPRTASNKIMRRNLRKLEADQS
ncbi:AMP-binding protein [Mariniblastus fucicola]|uniref:Acetyl-coenzyme A synthetase n=1 Tax=Mariniblastus fucicola TaxID=980251 RepID=A0A5B9PA18_9BACT|nr:AMP-binding protein [Mariniblastus fucicola]QEG23198.1 Acetyl-coenzyme A synthetase [Mariniblastus fucicola]